MATKYKDSGIPWIGEVPEDWKFLKFKYSGSFEKGKLPNSTNAENKGLPIIGASEMNGKEPTIFTEQQDIPLCSNEDILILWDGANAGLISNNLQGIVSSTVVKYVCKEKQCNSGYIYYQYKTLERYFKSKVSGTTIPHMNMKFINDCPLLLPPLPTQQRIADFLDRKCAEIDELAALQETMIEELKRYKQSLITETVTKGLNKNAKMKDSGVEWIGEIPERWEVKRLKFVANRRNEKADDTKLKYIGLEHIVGFSKEMVETENVYDNEGANMCYARDVIFGKLRPYLGKAKVIEDACCCSSEFIVLCNVHCPDYLRYLLLSGWFIEIVNASTYGTKMPRANADFIMNMLIPVPHTNEQQQIADYLDRKCAEIDELIVIKQQKIEALKEYKKSVIFEYVTGKKEVV